MTLNQSKCQHCKDFHSPPADAAQPVIAETHIVKRGGSPFYECPRCWALYAVKPATGSKPLRYTIISSASATVMHEWIVDGEDGSREKAKGKMTEEEAAEKHSNAVKVPLRVVR
jgi:hypothetical protein